MVGGEVVHVTSYDGASCFSLFGKARANFSRWDGDVEKGFGVVLYYISSQFDMFDTNLLNATTMVL